MSSLPPLERSRLYTSDVASRIDTARSTAIMSDTFSSVSGSSVDRALKTDLHYYLPDDILTLTDRLSMWHSLELRVPFLDHSFVETVMGIPSSLKIRGMRQKYLLKEVAKKWLPAPVINHRKQGFEAPMGRWLKGPLRTMMQDTLSPEAVAAGGILNVTEIERLKREHLTGIRKHSKTLFSLLMFQLWFNKHRTMATHRSDTVRDNSRTLASDCSSVDHVYHGQIWGLTEHLMRVLWLSHAVPYPPRVEAQYSFSEIGARFRRVLCEAVEQAWRSNQG